MQYFYDTYGTPLWQMMDSDLETNLTLAINKLCAQTKSKEYIQQLANEFAWFFMISLKLAWWQILKAVLRMPVIIPIIVEVSESLILVFIGTVIRFFFRSYVSWSRSHPCNTKAAVIA